MKKQSYWVAIVVTMILILLCPVLATAVEVSAMPFIKAQYYKGQGDNALTLEKFQANPRIYYRSEDAYQMSRQYAERITGRELTDIAFNELLQSDRVRTMLCNGKVTTGGLLPQDYHWFERQCYSKEEILQVQVGGRWVDLLSLACLNPIEDKTPPPLETAEVDEDGGEPPSKNCRWVLKDRSVQVIPGQLLVQQPTILAGCYGSIAVGVGVYQMPSSENVSATYIEVCD